ncbi:hypothetical protein [Flavobacterium calami]
MEYGKIINELEVKLNNITDDKYSLEGLVNMGIEKLAQLNYAFEKASLAEARDLIGLIYPENFTFKNNQFQTARVNEITTAIYVVNKELQHKKKGTKDDFNLLSRRVTFSSQFTNHFMNDLKKLAYFQMNL